eukprot:gene1136-1111_t
MQSTHPAPTPVAIEIIALTKRYASGKPAGKVGVRTDHLQIAPAQAELPWGAQRMQAVVTDVEYQGTYVLVGLQKHGAVLSANATAAYSVMVSEAAFAAQPYQVGQGVQLHWTPEQAHPLSVAA